MKQEELEPPHKMNQRYPDWTPQVEPGFRLLVSGASGGIGRALIAMLDRGPHCVVGAHRNTSPALKVSVISVMDFQSSLDSETECVALVDDFVERAGGVDGLVTLSGGITRAAHWHDLEAEEWRADIDRNLNIPFFLARAVMKRMDQGGRIVLTSTESALHGGSPISMAYSVAKRGTECLVQGLAREGAKKNVLVNAIRPGYIRSGFHQRWQGKNEQDMQARAKMVPLKRGGEPEEVAALIIYLLSGWAEFITGQMLPITGGDWL
jgi:NAD(P)-dependent dehydrogenase (short-subunit alcohol dehydrogenase family)